MKTMMQVSMLARNIHHSPLALAYLPVHLLLWDNTHYFWFLLTTLAIMEGEKTVEALSYPIINAHSFLLDLGGENNMLAGWHI